MTKTWLKRAVRSRSGSGSDVSAAGGSHVNLAKATPGPRTSKQESDKAPRHEKGGSYGKKHMFSQNRFTPHGL